MSSLSQVGGACRVPWQGVAGSGGLCGAVAGAPWGHAVPAAGMAFARGGQLSSKLLFIIVTVFSCLTLF